MSIVRWEPFRELISLREAMDRLFEESFVRPTSLLPTVTGFSMDMYETDDAVVVEAVLPGVRPEDVDVSVTGDTLTIKAEVKEEKEEKGRTYYFREIRRGSVSRSEQLPVPVVADKAKAEYRNGVLRLTLPKAEEAKKKTIKVEVH
jgi:HSP20 family protein